MARLFLALWPDAPLRHQLVQWQNGWRWPRSATPTRTERLHVTLHFLGEVEQAALPHLAASLEVPCEPFELRFGHNALWHSGLAVLEPLATPPELIALHARLSAAVTGAGLAVDSRPYRPHVTLARRAGKALIDTVGPPITWQVSGYALVQSTPEEGYIVLAQWPGRP
ncbi:RNA 2',3'-cyclic phosphodiesterase [Massilia sp. PAMC28688]|uniref:RNA 2',3'-cyclic phosphodiesterase n=1 Tax=Massilia sp. PAMC28688 TaxID=2861283 RepID=UPI001C6387B4|nr:RNA 2',3'-cyclic phosphodiesterase [Massilia sp. PAMC28688]QYF95657.1 RNA 2',3'-cyclic phosphodiesterase [Massilia sp. PAMC28688]